MHNAHASKCVTAVGALFVLGVSLGMAGLAACSTPGAMASVDAGSDAGSAAARCVPSLDDTALHLAVAAALPAGSDTTLCLRYTIPQGLDDLTGFVGHLGPGGHHALLLALDKPSAPDGVSPCSEAEIMDSRLSGTYSMLAGVSYESSDQPVTFPAAPVQVGLRVAAGTQLVFETHFVNAQASATNSCTTLTLSRSAPVVLAMIFRTVIPKEEYTLTIPAGQTVTATYTEPAGDRYRIAAASSHMHDGGEHFKMQIKETGVSLYETSTWSEPMPALYDVRKIVIESNQTFQLDCTFHNRGATDQHFPDQMCVGGMYLLPCTFPGEC